MNEKLIPKIEKTDIQAPEIMAGGTAIVLQRHSRYERDRSAPDAGSIQEEDSKLTKEQAEVFFKDVLAQESADGVETMVMVVSSDTQYAGKGHRSMETAQLAQDAAKEAFTAAGVDPTERIINLSPNFKTKRHADTDQDIRPMKGIVEPKIFDETPGFVKELGRMFNPPEVQAEIDARRTDVQLTPQAFGAYEADVPEVQELREKHGAEGVRDILDRTKRSLLILQRYARLFHSQNPDKRLVIWAASHYDTISPLVKDTTGTGFEEFVPVDYGGGVVLTIEPGSEEATMHAQRQKVAVNLGAISVSNR